MKLLNRYASAVHTDDMTSHPKTIWSDSDVLGAAGIASKTNELSRDITRMLSGDKRAAKDVVERLAHGSVTWAWKARRQKLDFQKAREIAQAVLAWWRFAKVCKPCDGTGYEKVPPPQARINLCVKCNGTGATQLERFFEPQHRDVAAWVASEIDRRQGEFGPAAIKALAHSMEWAKPL